MSIDVRSLAGRLARLLGRPFRVLREATPADRRALDKPALLVHIAARAHQAQVALAAAALFLLFLATPIAESISRAVFSPDTSKKILGLVKLQSDNPLQSPAEITLLLLFWILLSGLVAMLSWLELPKGIQSGSKRAKELTAQAEAIAKTNPTRSLAFYKKARSLTIDAEDEEQLRATIGRLALSTANGAADNGTPVENTPEEVQTIVPSNDSSLSDSGGIPSGFANRYRLGEKLGQGAMGVVYCAWDTLLDREVALKKLALSLVGDDDFVARFHREAKALARLTHPNIVQVYDLCETDGQLWMVLEFVEGVDLARHLKDCGRLSVADAITIMLPVAEGLASAHQQGIVHRDLKPANILITTQGSPKILDFGIAKLPQSSAVTQVGSVLGSPPYMSPEQCSGGSVDHRTDLYAFGITLYELLTGQVPFDGETAGVLAKHIIEPPPPPSELVDSIPDELEQVILQMLAKTADERPADLEAVIKMLSPFAKKTAPLSV